MFPLLNGFLLKEDKLLEIYPVKVMKRGKSVGILHHKSFSNNESINLISLCFANIVFMHGKRLD